MIKVYVRKQATGEIPAVPLGEVTLPDKLGIDDVEIMVVDEPESGSAFGLGDLTVAELIVISETKPRWRVDPDFSVEEMASAIFAMKAGDRTAVEELMKLLDERREEAIRKFETAS